jgi:drug/metabolite transporter (DMT)-like permease
MKRVGQSQAAAAALVLNAFIWGTSWWPFRQLQDMGVHPLWATLLIYGLAALVILCWRPQALLECLRTPSLWPLMLASGCTNACFNWAVAEGDVVRVVLLFYLMPLWAVLLARWLLQEAITVAALARVGLALLGAACVLMGPAAWNEGRWVWPLPQSLPDVLGLLGGMSFALNNVMLKREAHRSDAARALAMFLGGVVVAGGLAVGLGSTGHISGWPAAQANWLLATLALALLFLGSNLALQYGAARLAANVTAVIMLSEVVFASATAWAFGAGALNAPVLLGGGLIVGAAAWAAWPRPAPPQAPTPKPEGGP